MLINRILKLKKLIIVGLFLCLPLGYFARINIGSVFVGLYYWDILLVAYLVLSFGYLKNLKSNVLNLPLFYKLIFGFLVYAAIVTLNSYRFLNSLEELGISSLYLVRWGIYMIFGVVLYLDFKAKYLNLEFVKNLLIFEGFLISIIGFLQLIFIPDFKILDKSLMWDPHQNRLTGLYFDPNFAGIILVLILSVLLSEILSYFENKRSPKLLALYIFSFLTIFSALILTFSRSAWLALTALIFVVGLIKYKWIIPLAILGIFLVYYAVPRVQTRLSGITDPSDSFYFRYISWAETVDIAKQNPIIGYGFNTYRYIRQNMGYIKYDEGSGDRSDSGSDSSLLFLWVTTGLIGLGIFLAAQINLFSISLKSAKADNLALMFTGFQVALLVNSQFINSLFFPAVSVNLVVFTALFLVVRKTP